jgi:type II secretory pathway predicted ATPase ExeA
VIDDTIHKLKLNERIFSDRRIKWIHTYYKGIPATIEGLRKKAPFIAYELERQDLVEEIKLRHERYLRMTGQIK